MAGRSILWKSLGIALIASGSLRADDSAKENSAPMAKAVIQQYCLGCHNAKLKTAGLVLDTADIERTEINPDLWEKVTRKFRTAEMPPSGRPRPDTATYRAVT